MLKRAFLPIALTFALVLAATVPADYADAALYGGNKCVSSKIKEAGKLCGQYLKAWSSWDKTQDTAKRDAALAKAGSKFLVKWGKADTKALAKGVDCADTTMDAATAEGIVDAGVTAVAGDVNTGLALVPAGSNDGKCGAKLLKEAAKKCAGILKSYSKFIKNPGKDSKRVKLNAKVGKVTTKFQAKFDAGLLDCTNSTATTAGVEALVDAIRDDVKTGTTISPNVPDTMFGTYTHPGPGQPGHEVKYEGDTLIPRCQDFSEYSFFAKRGTENKLLMYYQGGGVCWSGATCCLNTCDQDVNVAGNDNPNNGFQTGFGDINNPANPFRNWNIVFVAYCSCDIHTGDRGQSYANPLLCGGGGGRKAVEHRGFSNAKLAEKFAREHFLDPEEVYVTGSSAGAFGSLAHVTPLARIYSHSVVNQLADAGTFEPTQGFADTVFDRWGLTGTFESLDVPGIDVALIRSPQFLEGAVESITAEFPDVRMSQFLTAYDGSTGGLGGFYHVMLHHPFPGEPDALTVATWPRWWDSTCSFNAVAEAQMASIESVVSTQNDNYRYYLGSGSRHTMFGSNKVYDSTLGGVETVLDFVNKERARDPNDPWTTQIASPRNVLIKRCLGGTNNGESCPNGITDCPDQGGGTQCVSGDPRPNPLECPFKTSGADTIVDCASCP